MKRSLVGVSKGGSAIAAVLMGICLAIAFSVGPTLAAALPTSPWTVQTSGTTSDLYAVAFADEECGWAAGDGVILATTDGGQTWTQQATGLGLTDLSGLSCTDRQHCWVIGYYGGAFTTDGGKTWTAVEEMLGESVCFIDNQRGWTGYRPSVDGGKTWVLSGEFPEFSDSTGDYWALISAVSFADADHGWACGSWHRVDGGAIKPALFFTTDGGRTWESQSAPAGVYGEFNGMDFVDSTHGWAVGYSGSIAATNDGGATWVRQDSATGDSLNSVSFVDVNQGWAVGWSIEATTDGGQTWVAQEAPDGLETLKDVCFVDVSHGWAVGTGGIILCYTGSAGPVFTDLKGYDWARTAIESLAGQEILRGMGGGRFDPGGVLTRDQVAALLQRVFQLPQPAQPVSYSDVPVSHWAYSYVQASSTYIPPLAGNTFGAGVACDREDAATALVRVLDEQGLLEIVPPGEADTILAGVPDAGEITPALRQLIATSIKYLIVRGMEDGSFVPAGLLTRAQAAVLLDRVQTTFLQ